jgi:hypothetical protein
MRTSLLVITCLLGACADPQRSPTQHVSPPDATIGRDAPRAARRWPALPRSRNAAEALIHSSTRRAGDGTATVDLSPSSVMALPALSGEGKLVVGQEAIIAWLAARMSRAGAHDAYLLWGTYHDSGGQVEAFRRLIGPGGLPELTTIVVEQFDADGHWAELPTAPQRGDDAVIDAFLQGDRESFDRLASKQRRVDYTAWKYSYLPTVMDLLLAARAVGRPLFGCDMPRPLQHVAEGSGSALYRLRDLHCLFALEERLAARPRRTALRVAMLWGQDHVAPHGVRRFLPSEALALSCYVLGHRPGPLTPEAQLRRRLVINDPVLLPLDAREEQILVLLPGPDLSGTVDRAREPIETRRPPEGPATLVVRSAQAGTLHVAGRSVAVGPRGRELALPPGPQPYVLRVGEQRVIGVVTVGPGDRLVLTMNAAARRTEVLLQEPSAPSIAR